MERSEQLPYRSVIWTPALCQPNFLPPHECYIPKKIVLGKFIWRVEESDEAGRFLVATRDIRKGEVHNIFKESAIIKIKIKININTDIKIHILSTSSSSTLQKGGVIWSPSGRRSNLHTDSACLSWVPEVVQVLVEMLRVSQPADHIQCHKVSQPAVHFQSHNHYNQVSRPCHQRQVPRVWIASLRRSVPGRTMAQVVTTSHLPLIQILLTQLQSWLNYKYRCSARSISGLNAKFSKRQGWRKR